VRDFFPVDVFGRFATPAGWNLNAKGGFFAAKSQSVCGALIQDLFSLRQEIRRIHVITGFPYHVGRQDAAHTFFRRTGEI